MKMNIETTFHDGESCDAPVLSLITRFSPVKEHRGTGHNGFGQPPGRIAETMEKMIPPVKNNVDSVAPAPRLDLPEGPATSRSRMNIQEEMRVTG